MRGVGVEGHPTPPAGPEGGTGSELKSVERVVPSAVFLECFAGEGVLSDAVAAFGVEVVKDEAAADGTDFLEVDQVEALRSKMETWLRSGRAVALHLAPPCSTFSRARDRSRRTRLRSARYPQGLPATRAQMHACV